MWKEKLFGKESDDVDPKKLPTKEYTIRDKLTRGGMTCLETNLPNV